ncbi:MAG: ATP-grasp domain-containing protein [Desulfovibrio sp.]
MFILDKPFVSRQLVESAKNMCLPVLDTSVSRDLCGAHECELQYLADDIFVEQFKNKEGAARRLYCNSENSLAWIADKLGDTELPAMVEACKNKVRFRELLQDVYPDFYFREILLDELKDVDPAELKYPFVIKPSVGFFSIGVHIVQSEDQWAGVRDALLRDAAAMNDEYPEEVVGSGSFIVEQIAEGTEYAMDAYYDENGEPVILNILKHDFASGDDVSDRLYYTSTEVMRENMEIFKTLLTQFGERAGLKNFPVHVEARVDENNYVVPIEANPMRFAGWCVTDLAGHAWGIDVYNHYLENIRPDWDELLKDKDGLLFAMMIGDLPADVRGKDVAKVDYAAFSARYEKVLELREINWQEYPVFAFVFTETRETHRKELDDMLRIDMNQFLELKSE